MRARRGCALSYEDPPGTSVLWGGGCSVCHPPPSLGPRRGLTHLPPIPAV